MNILILMNHFNAGGIAKYVLNLAKGLTSRGHKVYIASRGGEWGIRLGQYGSEHIYIPLHTKSILSPQLLCAYSILKKIIKQRHIDILHSQTRITSVLAYWLCRKTNVPFVSTAHGFFKVRLERRIFPCWGKLVIAISDPVRQHLIQDFKVDAERVRLVHNGIEVRQDQKPLPQADAPTAQEIRQSFGLKAGPVVGIIARLSEVKGHIYLIRAMKKVIEQIPDAQLLSIGDGKIKKGLEDLARSLGIAEKVHFLPTLSDTSKAFLAMDIFVMPSLEEGLGLAIMEAMGAKVPVVASAVGGIPSLVKHGQTGILVGPGDPHALASAILEVLQDKEKAGKLKSHAYDFISKEFSFQKMVDETEKVYQECLA